MKHIILFILFTASLTTAYAESLLVSILPDDKATIAARQLSPTNPSYVLNSNKIQLNASPSSVLDLSTYLNKTFVFAVNPQKRIVVTFTEGEMSNNILTLRGKTDIDDALNSSMVIGDGGYLITIDDYRHGQVYHLNGRLIDGIGQSQHVDSQILTNQQQQRHQSPFSFVPYN